MIRKNRTVLDVLCPLLDGLLTFLSYFLAISIRFDLLDGFVSIPMNSLRFQAVAGLYAVVVVLCYAACHLYQPERRRSLGRSAGVVFLVNALCVLIMMSLLFTFRLIDVSRSTLFIFLVISTLAVCLRILLAERIRRADREKGRHLRRVIVVGNGTNASLFMRDIAARPELGVSVEGYVSAVPREGLGKNLGRYEDLGAILERGGFDEIVVALEPHEVRFMKEVLSVAEKEGVRVEMIPFFNEYYPTHPTIESVGNTRLVDLRATPLDNVGLAAVKRAGDFVISLLLLIVLSPLMLAIALGVKLSSPGPVLFKQERIGKDKKPFIMLKFRSMRTDVDHNGWSTKSDPRKTRFGSMIRKLSLDELPQLINVLTGSMSLVGPRPEIPVYVRRFKEEVPLYLVRQQVRPGMTGWAQIHGLRGDTSIEDRVTYDIWYIQNWSLALDLKILLKTAFGGMFNTEELGASRTGRGQEKS